MKKFTIILKRIIIIVVLIISINTMMELIRIKNSWTNKPLIILTERSSPNHYYYYSIGFSEEFIYEGETLKEVNFRLFNTIKIWSKKNEK